MNFTWPTINYPGIIFFAMMMAFIFVIYVLNKSNKADFQFEDLLVEPKTGKASVSKLAQIIALVTSTWAFIALTLDSKLTEWFYVSYMGVWVLNRGMTQYFGKDPNPGPGPADPNPGVEESK
jgi:hypothetical protein